MENVHPPAPAAIGPYRVLQVLGTGGMGAVYEAEETGSVRRRVAVKVIRGGANSAEVIERFDAERQALAMMNHPGIARVFQAGATDAGEPWFSMELVRGLPLTEYCDLHRLSIPERLELFIEVCKAAQHAHHKSVVHRDLKPSNVLVTDVDGVRQPKIIDFGVAKALGQQLTTSAFVTLAGTAIGTAAYMSPEQADTTGVDVDTRSDIYSLGVMLYELLIGELPIDPRLTGVHAFIAQMASQQTDPPKPSARLSGSHRSGSVAFARRTDAKHLRRELRGDLDWIVMMAMQPDRMHRYTTAASLADDLQRHLRHEPVVARPPTTRYRVERFVARHRTGVVTAAGVFVAMTIASIVATVGFLRATAAEQKAAREAQAAQQVTAFLVGLFNTAAPGLRADTITARDILARGAARISTELVAQPLLQSRLMTTLGTVHLQLGFYDDAGRLFDDAVRIREREVGPNDTLVATSLGGVGEAARQKGAFNLADSALQRSLQIRRATFGPEHVDVAAGIAALALLRGSQQRLAESESLFRIVIPLDERLRPPGDAVRPKTIRSLGVMVYRQGRLAEADSLTKRALALQEQLFGKDHVEVASTLNNLGGIAFDLGQYPEALAYYERAQLILEPVLGPSHTTVIGLYNNIGEANWKLKRYAAADSLLRHSLALKEKALPPTHASIGVTVHALAGVLRDVGRYREAEPFYRRALAIREPSAATAPRYLTETLRDYAGLMQRTGRTPEAARLIARADSLATPKK